MQIIPRKQRSTGSSSLILSLVFLIYPLFFMGKTLTLNTTLRLGHQPSDYNLTIRQVQGWKNLRWPWSPSSFDTFPHTQSSWRFEDLVNLHFRIYAWLAARVLEANFIVNFYTFAGMVATGLCIYVLIREFEITRPVAVLGGVIGQMLPWLRQNILFGPAGSWYTVGSLLIILFVIRFQKNPTISAAFKVLFGLILCFSLSAYSFLFSIYIILFIIISEIPRISKWSRQFSTKRILTVIASGLFVVLLSTAIAVYLLSQTRSEFGTPFGVYDKQTVLASSGTWKGFVTPDHFHLLFPRKDSYYIDGDQQNYAGVVLVIFALLGLFQIGRSKSFGQFRTLIISAIGFLLLTLGRFRLGPIDIPSLREYARFIMPGIRQFVRAGLIFEHILIVFSMIFLSMVLEKISSRRVWITTLVFAFLLISLDLNPSSRRVIWDYSNRFEEVRKILKETPEKGLFVPNGVTTFPTIGVQGLADVFNAPLHNDLIRVYPFAARGSVALSKYLVGLEVDFVFARLEKNTGRPYMTGYIQDAARFTTYFNEPEFSPASQVVVMENRDDTGRVLESWSGRLLRVNTVPEKLFRLDRPVLAQFASSPSLEVRDAGQNRFLNNVDWSISKQITLTPESLLEPTITGLEEISFRLHLQFVSPSELSSAGVLSYLVKVGSEMFRYEVADNSDMIQIDVPKGQTASIELLTNCVFTSSDNGYWGLLAGREVCFGIADYWVEALIGPQP